MPLVRVEGGAPERGPGGSVITSQPVVDLLPAFTPIRVSTNYSVGQAKRFILADATNGAITITLPLSPNILPVTVKKIDASGNTVTIQARGTGLVDGSANHVLGSQNEAVFLVSSGSDWYSS